MTSSPRGLRALLLIATVGAGAVLLSFLGRIAELAGVVLIAVAALAAPAPPVPDAGVRWHRLLGTGAVICAVALPLSLLFDTIGGLLAGIGAALVIVAVAFGWPRVPKRPTEQPPAPHAP